MKLCSLTSDIYLICLFRVGSASLNVRIRGGAGWGRSGGRVRVTLFRLLFSREIIEIKSLDARAAILDECTKPRWPPVSLSARSWRSYERELLRDIPLLASTYLCICEKNVYTMPMEPLIFLTIIPRAWMNNCFSKIQLVGQKYRE